MGLLIVLYDWTATIRWPEEESFCLAALRRFGIGAEFFVYRTRDRSSQKWRSSKIGILPLDELVYGGVYNFDGGSTNLPQPNAACVCMESVDGEKTFYLYVDRQDLNIRSNEVSVFLSDLVLLKPHGCGFVRAYPREEVPEAFVTGLGAGAVDSRTVDETTAWIATRRQCQTNRAEIIRDIFPLNILPVSMLSKPVGKTGMSLSTWINALAERGKIDPISSGNATWSIDDQNVIQVRGELRSHSFFPKLR